jgi:hypothetical protein
MAVYQCASGLMKHPVHPTMIRIYAAPCTTHYIPYLRNKRQIVRVEPDGLDPPVKVVLAELERAVQKISQVPEQLRVGLEGNSQMFKKISKFFKKCSENIQKMFDLCF